GAASVLAVDVGYAQFDWSLRRDQRVMLRERTNMVDLPDDANRHTIDLAVCDVSFTSVKTVLPAVMEMLRPEGSAFLTLVKPQFEAARDEVGEGGVVSDPAVHLRTLREIAEAFAAAGLEPVGACPSPITGHKGNREFLLLGRRTGTPGPEACDLDLDAVALRGEVALSRGR
ncbi:MAG: SAM-dependent methyltransferase, partial [Parafannyhessea sp.]|uniref:SAM-dependent methyltransferase n=1 Tax=Parafannyhessea sp. TaxID=2847324 RepID=UPI003F02DEF6